jgi:6-phosphogluconolactonase
LELETRNLEQKAAEHRKQNAMKLKIFPDIEELNNFAAEKFVEIAKEAIEKRGQFTVALAGGSTPKALYELLASDRFKNNIDWSRVYFFFGDERHVPPDDPLSNFRMANESLFEPLKILKKNIFRWMTEEKHAEIVADDYESWIWDFFVKQELLTKESDKEPAFDLVLLGMGADGHTASLFPFTEALGETEKLAVANPVEKLNATRLTLTFPVFNNARNIIFLIAGEEKAEALKAVLEGASEPEKFPSQNIKPENGNLFWLVDERAASLLHHK